MKPYEKSKFYSKGSARQKARQEITQLTIENGYQKELDDDYDWDIEVTKSLYCYHYKPKCDCFED